MRHTIFAGDVGSVPEAGRVLDEVDVDGAHVLRLLGQGAPRLVRQVSRGRRWRRGSVLAAINKHTHKKKRLGEEEKSETDPISRWVARLEEDGGSPLQFDTGVWNWRRKRGGKYFGNRIWVAGEQRDGNV